ncbi:MAG: long-chain fatty acid--CoA ligase [Candidatus Omnitrophica bacterium]|nr:long-chain fatty acid--CoA ligase [Candidatus Omnitrophota bacterium]
MEKTIPLVFFSQAQARAAQPLFLVKRSGTYGPITWAQAAGDVEALAAFLLQSGVEPGQRVIILSENRPEWGIADLAIQSIGGWTVPVYPSLSADDLAVICRDCQPVACIVSNLEQAKKLLSFSAQVPSIRHQIVMDPNVPAQTGWIHWSDVLAKGRAHLKDCRERLLQLCHALRLEDTATLIYTSGTTGEPKGVQLSHRNFLSNVQACLQVVPVSDTDLHLSFLPLSHVFERMAGWYLMLSVGACVAYAQSMDTVAQNMLEVHPTVMLGVPRFFEKLYAKIQEGIQQAPSLRKQLALWALSVGKKGASLRLSQKQPSPLLAIQLSLAERLVFKRLQAKLGGRVRFFISGGAALSKELAEFFYSVGVLILEGYGLTETSPVIAVNRPPLPRFGSVGQALPGVEVKIAEDGEILSRGPHIMQGYYQKPAETALVLREGWFHTGDIGHLDSEGFLFITDRKKDLIKTAGGKFVAPQKLETRLVADPYISQAFVYGEGRPFCIALIVPRAEALLRYALQQNIEGSLKELVKDSRILAFYWQRVETHQANFASFERVKHIALLDQEFSQASGELTATLKAKRNIIAQRYHSLLELLYQIPPS